MNKTVVFGYELLGFVYILGYIIFFILFSIFNVFMLENLMLIVKKIVFIR